MPPEVNQIRINFVKLSILKIEFKVPPRVSPQMISQISLDAQLDAADSSFADFAHFPETVIEHEVSEEQKSGITKS